MARLSGPEGPTSLCIEYRPMLSMDRAFLLTRIRSLLSESDDESGLASAEQIVLAELDARVISWTMSDESGSPLIVSESTLRGMESTLLASIASVVLGFDEQFREGDADRERNLVQGVQLLLSNPLVAVRDCEDCQKHVYDEQTGRRIVHANLPVIRPSGTNPPCRISQVGCPKGSPEQLRTLSLENQHVYSHYRECQATGSFPDDPIVRRHAALIQAVESASFQQSFVSQRPRSSYSATPGHQDGE